MYTIGSFIGSLALAFIITRVFYFLGKKIFPKVTSVNSVIFSCIFFLIIATILGGYGFASDDEPVFAQAFFQYLPAGLIFLIFDLYRVKSSAAAADEISTHALADKKSSDATESQKKFCSNCGSKLDGSSNFCGNCGAAV